jgi:mannose-1-phosphate guanylyltransferase/MurNAc alpha-1-phosphate uridylyltransferase
VPLLDLALDRVRALTADVAVNVHHCRDQIAAHLGGRAHLSIEEEQALGTAGALGALRDWIHGRPAVVVNADAWCPGGLEPLLAGWDGARPRVLVAGEDELRPSSLVVGSVVPWDRARDLAPEPAGLFEAVWAPAAADGHLEVVRHEGPFVDCGTPAAYLAANLAASGGESVVGEGAAVAGELVRSVVWPGGVVRRGEVLVDAIRVNDRETVLVRPPH